MIRALVVEDHDKWQKFHKNYLESILGKDNIDITDNYECAISMLGQEYGLYIIDGQFFRTPDGELQLLGIQLAEDVRNKEGGYDKIVIVSSSDDTLFKAQLLGVFNVYNKSYLNNNEKEVLKFKSCVKTILCGVNDDSR